ncbi:MAG: hypothetical protein JNL70_22605 [Saprospiraceae bacterium]|nr:hypothetical protein [Saprospiraceae bacterium]
MIKVKSYFDDEPIELWEDASKKRNKSKNNLERKTKIEQALLEQSKHNFDGEIYGSKIVKKKLKEIYHCKCAFCESNTHAGAHKDVEHFRAKSQYYWLVYEWTNLLLSCQICNRDFKKVLFPLVDETKRITSPPLSKKGELDKQKCHILSDTLKAEQALLLHPAIDDPQKHIKFSSDGDVKKITFKGEKSIEVYGLDRPELIKKRKALIAEFQEDIWEEYRHTVPDENRIKIEVTKVIDKLIKRIENPNSEYIGFTISILNNFEEFIIDNQSLGIDLPNKDIMRQIARSILQ